MDGIGWVPFVDECDEQGLRRARGATDLEAHAAVGALYRRQRSAAAGLRDADGARAAGDGMAG